MSWGIQKRNIKRKYKTKLYNLQKEYGAYISLKKLPDENDFNHFDTNKDGKLLFDEWLTQINKDVEMNN